MARTVELTINFDGETTAAQVLSKIEKYIRKAIVDDLIPRAKISIFAKEGLRFTTNREDCYDPIVLSGNMKEGITSFLHSMFQAKTKKNTINIYLYRYGEGSYWTKIVVTFINDNAVDHVTAKPVKLAIENSDGTVHNLVIPTFEERQKKTKNILNEKKEKKTMKNLTDVFTFRETTNDCGISFMNGGIAYKKSSDTFVQFSDGCVNEIPADMVINMPTYIMSTPLADVKVGDVVYFKNSYAFVGGKDNNTLKLMLADGTTTDYVVPKNILFGNMQMIPKVMSFFSNMFGTGAASNGMFANPMMMMMMMKDDDMFGGGDTMKQMMMMQMFANMGQAPAPVVQTFVDTAEKK